jgi:hypothetical protein
MDYVN